MAEQLSEAVQVEKEKTKRNTMTIVIVIGAIVLLLVSCCGISLFAFKPEDKSGTSTTTNTSTTTDTVEDTKGSFDNPYVLGEVVTVDNVDWTLTEAQNLGSTLSSSYGEYGSPCVANSGSFVRITVKVKNNSDKMVTVTDINLYDASKREFITSSDVFGCVDDALFLLDNINPGIEKTFSGVYEIPSDATGLRVKVGDLNMFKADEEYISLGF